MYTVNFVNDCLQIFNLIGDEEGIVIKAQSLLKDYSFQPNLANTYEWRLFCLEDTGKLYCIESHQVINELSYSNRNINNDNPENQEIFTDLLESCTVHVECVEDSVPVLNLKPCNLLHTVEGRPLSVCCHTELVILLTEDGGMYTFTVLRLQPGETSVMEQTQRLYFKKSVNSVQDESCLLKVITADLIEDNANRADTTDSVRIENELFKCLFGHSTALVHSPVLLFCPPEGSVYSIPVHGLFSTEQELAWLEATKTSNPWRIFCETLSVVVEILTLRVPLRSSTDDPYNDVEDDKHVLLVCCCNGTVIAFYYDHSKHNHLYLSQFVVNGQVTAAASFHNRLYHSTDRHLYESSLEIIETQQGASGDHRINITMVKDRKQTNIRQIKVEPMGSFTETREAPCILHCTQKDGTKRCLDSSIVFDDPTTMSSDKLHFKDILVAIDKTDNDQHSLTEKIKTCDHLLEQISVAAFLLNRDMNEKNMIDDAGKQPFHCTCKVVGNNLQRTGVQGYIDVLCEITNQMPRKLSSDWSLEITVIPSQNEHETQSNLTTTSTILPFVNGFNVKETATLGVPIHPDLMTGGFDLIWTLNLNIRLSELCSIDTNTCLSVMVCRQTLDVLNFLVPKQACFQIANDSKSTEMSKQIETLAYQRPSANWLILNDKDNAAQESKPIVSLSRQLKFTNKQYHLLKNRHGQDPECILNFLLKDSQLPPIDRTRNKCHVMTLTGSDLYLEVEKGKVLIQRSCAGDGPRETTLVVLHIQSDLSTAASVSIAIDRRLKEDCFENSGFPASSVGLRKTRRNLEMLEMDIQAVMNKKMSDRERREEIGKLYQRLRTCQSYTE